MRKNVIDGRKHFIGRLHKTGEDDWDKLWANDSGHNEGRQKHLGCKKLRGQSEAASKQAGAKKVAK